MKSKKPIHISKGTSGENILKTLRIHPKFCWECSRKLWGNKKTILYDREGNEYILHKSCSKNVLKNKEYNDWGFHDKGN